eukprot:CAMPEP_0170566700 /NCGR_PEP_ID=MMETSP0211-20121228/80008_1 /TAXON_ID=311385 /ORGANISM="Pseudokeronopsis sp., Strain OXSARD2" /LENGTH=158 /DNA_ID=CAMNT_0010887949 /DNA_START=392 /DNA_END=868 /DNA_ORIENTATION=-
MDLNMSRASHKHPSNQIEVISFFPKLLFEVDNEHAFILRKIVPPVQELPQQPYSSNVSNKVGMKGIHSIPPEAMKNMPSNNTIGEVSEKESETAADERTKKPYVNALVLTTQSNYNMTSQNYNEIIQLSESSGHGFYKIDSEKESTFKNYQNSQYASQ